MGQTVVVAGPVGIEAVSLDEGVESFLVYCQAKGGTSGTIYRYRAGLVRLARYLQEHCGVTTLDEVTTDHLLAYIEHRRRQGQLRRNGSGDLAGRPLSDAALAGIAHLIRHWWGYTVDAGLVERNPAEKLPCRTIPQPRIATFSEDQLRPLLGQPDLKTSHGLRDWAARAHGELRRRGAKP